MQSRLIIKIRKNNKNTIKHIKKNNIKKRRKRIKRIQYGFSKQMKGGNATLNNPISNVGGYIENSFSSLESTLNGETTINSFSDNT